MTPTSIENQFFTCTFRCNTKNFMHAPVLFKRHISFAMQPGPIANLIKNAFGCNRNTNPNYARSKYPKYSHKFPFSDKVHNLKVNCVSYVCDAVSWDVLVHSNSFQYHLQNLKRCFRSEFNFKTFMVIVTWHHWRPPC